MSIWIYPVEISVACSIGLANGVLRQRVDVFQVLNLAATLGLGSRNAAYSPV